MTKTTKRYIVSSLITFASAFAVTVLPFISTISMEDFKNGVFASLVFTGLRAGIKALLELFVQPSQV